MPVIFTDSFESGDLSGYDLTAANGVAESSSTRPHAGSLGVRVHPTSSDSRVQKTGFSNSVLVARIWLNDDTSQNVNQKVMSIGTTGRDVFIQCLSSPHRFCLRGNIGGGDITGVDPGSATAYSDDTWNKLELAFDRSADPWNVRWAVNGVEQTSWQPAGGGAGTLTNVSFGTWAFVMTFDTYFDDFAIADSMADFQIPEARRRPLHLYGPAQLGAAAATVYTASAASKILLRHVHVSNPSGAAVGLTLAIGADGATTRILDDLEIPADSVQSWTMLEWLEPGEIIQAFADTAATLVLTLDGHERPMA